MSSQITKVMMPLAVYGTPAGTVTLEIYEGWQGSALGSLLGSSTVSVSTFPTTTIDVPLESERSSTSSAEDTLWNSLGIEEEDWVEFPMEQEVLDGVEPVLSGTETVTANFTIDGATAGIVVLLKASGCTTAEKIYFGGKYVHPNIVGSWVKNPEQYEDSTSEWVTCDVVTIYKLRTAGYSYYEPGHTNLTYVSATYYFSTVALRKFGLKFYNNTDVIGGILPDDEYIFSVRGDTLNGLYFGLPAEEFYVAPEKATNPYPADDAVDVLDTVDFLSWTGYRTATSYNVYFDFGAGTLPTSPTKITTADSIIIGHVLIESVTYKWRVDCVNEYGITTGDEWEFTVVTGPQLTNNRTEQCAWLSRTDDYDNFEVGVKDDDAFEQVIPTGEDIRWVGSLEQLLFGTAGNEWKMGSNKLETPLTPTNTTLKKQSDFGSNTVQPININSSLLFVDFVSRKLREMTFADPKYLSPDLTALAEHITLNGITSMSVQKNPDSILWATLGNGDLISLTYEREQNVVAWAKHPLGGDGYAQSVCVIPGATEDIVKLSVGRTINGEAVTYIEKMASRVFTTAADAFFVDCGITFTSVTATATITGLEHLEGETVQVLGDGVRLEDAVVANGQITASVPVLTAQVGLGSTAILKPMRIVMNSPGGSSMGKTTHINGLVISFLNTGAAKYGVDLNKLKPIDFTDIRWTNSSTIAGLFTGEITVPVPGNFDPLNPIFITSDGPMPLCVRAIVPDIQAT